MQPYLPKGTLIFYFEMQDSTTDVIEMGFTYVYFEHNKRGRPDKSEGFTWSPDCEKAYTYGSKLFDTTIPTSNTSELVKSAYAVYQGHFLPNNR